MKKIVLLIAVLALFSCGEDSSADAMETEIISVDYSTSEQTFTFDEDLELVKIEMECIYPCEQQFDAKTRFQFDDIQFVDFTPEIIENTIVFKKEYKVSTANHGYWNRSKKFKLTFNRKL